GIDVVINNAHRPYQRKWFEETSWDEFQRELDTLVKGPFNMIQSALPYMKARGNGQIINISSTMARSPELQHSFYVTAKNALVGLTRSLALELGQYGIRVNLVSPGPLETDHNAGLPKELMKQLHAETPLHARMATCEEVAGAIMLLTLPEAAMVTGTDLQVSGGQAIF
ncbi:MAG: SDR family oxidoreductase, partial [Rhodospirillales bacterium]|nr:SDR family oxidoreductase [Rhodospirillales bacterium]